MEDSPFNRSARTQRSPPPTPTPRPPAPEPTPPADKPPEAPPSVVRTAEIQRWLKTIQEALNEVCNISNEGKLNLDQKARINNLCRNVGHGASQVALEYQSLAHKTIQMHTASLVHQKQQDLMDQIKDLKTCITVTPKPAPATVSYAEVIKKGPNQFIPTTSENSIAIYQQDKTKSSDDTKALVQRIIRPDEMKLQVRGLRKTKNGGVIISTDTKEDIEKLKQSKQLSTFGLTVDDPQKRRPRIVVIGVPTSMQELEVLNSIFHQNIADKLQDLTINSFLSSVKLSHKSGKRDSQTCNYVLEVPALIRKALITQERIFINWSSCPVRDFTIVTRCFKCQLYGHAAKSCREETVTCGHCGEVGHPLKECTKKAESANCATCLKFKKPHNHSTGGSDCPAKKMAEKRYINSIDYDGA